VARLGPPWTVWPPARALGRLDGDGDAEDLARRMGEALAAEVSACGIRCDFVPIMDVDTNARNPIINNRAFSDDPEVVSRLGVAMIRGLQGGRVAGCAKHFPGHGDTDVDSHLALPVVEHGRSRFDDVELPPFRKAIEAGVATIMMAHVLYPDLDPELPASLSAKIVGGLLRGEMGYDGVVIADDLEMKAVAVGWGPARSAVLALQAGCDVIPVCEHHDAQVQALEGAIRGVEAEEIAWTALDDAARRVRRLKERYLLPYDDPDPRRARQTAGRGEFAALAQEIAARGGEAARFPWTSE
jgi:beta-N-acetylhexosaminidase